MRKQFTIAMLQQLQDKGIIRGFTEHNKQLVEQKADTEKKSKFGAKKTVIDGLTFASVKEGRRYTELKIMAIAGEIRELRIQAPFELNEGGSHSLKYIADFTYIRVSDGAYVVEDAKGHKTPVYQKKKRLMKQIHNIDITEV